MSTDDKKKPSASPTSAEVNARSQDMSHFKRDILDPYLKGTGDQSVDSTELLARSILPPMTAVHRSFASLAFEYPQFHADKCVACMECVISCPDAAMYARV